VRRREIESIFYLMKYILLSAVCNLVFRTRRLTSRPPSLFFLVSTLVFLFASATYHGDAQPTRQPTSDLRELVVLGL